MPFFEALPAVDPDLVPELQDLEDARDTVSNRIERLARRNQVTDEAISFPILRNDLPPRIRAICEHADFPQNETQAAVTFFTGGIIDGVYYGRGRFRLEVDPASSEAIRSWEVGLTMGLVTEQPPYLRMGVQNWRGNPLDIFEPTTNPVQISVNRLLKHGAARFADFHVRLLIEFANLIDQELERRGEKTSVQMFEELKEEDARLQSKAEKLP